MLPQFNYSSAEVKRVKKVQFGVLSPEEIKKMSVVEITKPGTIVGGLPIRNGLSDPALGTADPRSTCATCGNTYAGTGKVNDCPGHFGHIELASPVWHIGFMRTVFAILQCTCINCSRLLVDASHPDFARACKIRNGKKRLAAIHSLCKSKKVCATGTGAGTAAALAAHSQQLDADGNPIAGSNGLPTGLGGCGAHQPSYRRVSGLKITMEYTREAADAVNLADTKQVLTPELAYRVLRGISDEDARILGLNPLHVRPEWLIITVLPVAPPHVRPSVARDALNRAEDDITHKYADIVKANAMVAAAKKSGQAAIHIEQYEMVLQYHVATLVNNSIGDMPIASQRSGKAIKTFRDRLVGKGGRVRGNLMGKRVDFSARTLR